MQYIRLAGKIIVQKVCNNNEHDLTATNNPQDLNTHIYNHFDKFILDVRTLQTINRPVW